MAIIHQSRSKRMMMMMIIINKLSLELRLIEENVIAFLMAWNVIAFLGMDVIACLHGMECDSLPSWRRIMIAFLHGMKCDSLPSWHNVIAYLHDMVDKLAFMAWLLACLRGMDGKVSKIGSKARNDEIRNLKFIDTGLMKEKMKM
ncbi:hypothetical protein Tco_0857454 [Tanacetum coccineum]|uniref:Uncharacterized protein n=1 Tax=Tanacetum coccineum TaxID=301880 RepID=A0ABQ5B8F5_9ASTR